MGNALAYLMLVLWPVAAGMMFQRFEPRVAFIWTILGAYMLLSPLTFIALPIIPDLGKDSVSTIAAALLAMGAGYKVLSLPDSPILKILIIIFIACPWLTMSGNTEALVEGVSYRPALTPYDTFSTMIGKMFILLPFLGARSVLAGQGSERLMLRAFVVAGLVYSLPMLIEVRLSPQINVWVYGYFAHDFSQMMRYGGFRPMVFMTHGLWVALFAFMALGSAAALARDEGFVKKSLLVVLWLGLMVLLCKSMAPILYAIVVIPLLVLAPPRLMLAVAAGIAITVLTFPLLRLAGLIPVEQMTAIVLGIDPERAASLIFRLRNEDILLARSFEKLMAGWGGYGRALVVDPGDGSYETISDGRWIITLGIDGLLGYIAEFGLFTLPVLAAWRTRAARNNKLLASLVLIHATTLIDLIPNATITPLTFMLAGLITGRVEQLRRSPDTQVELRIRNRPIQAAHAGNSMPEPGLKTIL